MTEKDEIDRLQKSIKTLCSLVDTLQKGIQIKEGENKDLENKINAHTRLINLLTQERDAAQESSEFYIKQSEKYRLQLIDKEEQP